jgi:hypothetical protein
VHRVARRLKSDMAAFYPGIADSRASSDEIIGSDTIASVSCLAVFIINAFVWHNR